MTSIDRYHRSMTEDQMLSGISDVVHARGGRIWHIRDSRKSPESADMLDVQLIMPPYVGILELKSQYRKTTPGQKGVLELLEQCDRLLTGIVRYEPKVGEIAFSYDSLIRILKGDWE